MQQFFYYFIYLYFTTENDIIFLFLKIFSALSTILGENIMFICCITNCSYCTLTEVYSL